MDERNARRMSRQKESHALAYVLLIALWSALLAYVAWDRQAELAQAAPEAQALADAIADNTDRTVSSAEKLAATIARDAQREGIDVSLRVYAASGLVQPEGIARISVLDKNGIVRASTNDGSGTVDLSGSDDFRMHVRELLEIAVERLDSCAGGENRRSQ